MNPDFRDLLQVFNEERVRYLIIGGYAVIKHTEPRYTKDLDLWTAPDPENGRRVHAALTRFGAPLGELSSADFTQAGFFFTMGLPPSRVDILFTLDGLEFEDSWAKRVESTLGDIVVRFISRDDLIKNKELVGRLQDLADAEKLRLTDGEK